MYIFPNVCRLDENVVHIKLRYLNGQFDAGGGMRFSQLAELIDYYKKNPMIEKAGGNVVHLKAVSTTLCHFPQLPLLSRI